MQTGVVREAGSHKWFGPVVALVAVVNLFDGVSAWPDLWWPIQLAAGLWMWRVVLVPRVVVDRDRILVRTGHFRASLREPDDPRAGLQLRSAALVIAPDEGRSAVSLERPTVTVEGMDLEWDDGGRAWLLERVAALSPPATS